MHVVIFPVSSCVISQNLSSLIQCDDYSINKVENKKFTIIRFAFQRNENTYNNNSVFVLDNEVRVLFCFAVKKTKARKIKESVKALLSLSSYIFVEIIKDVKGLTTTTSY